MRVRVIGGVAAWLAGAAMATALTLSAVSALGAGITDDQVRTLSSDDVAHALASVTQSAAPPETSAGPTAPAPTPSTVGRSASPAPTPSDGGRSAAVSSPGGSAAAVCGTAGAYLSSWSPAQGFLVKSVSRGPARLVSVEFSSSGSTVVLRVGCVSGVPTSQVSTGHDDDVRTESGDH